MTNYDDTIQVNAQAVQPGDVLLTGEVVTAVTLRGSWVRIEIDSDTYIHPRNDALIAVREVVTD
jgi:hypothetical protein